MMEQHLQSEEPPEGRLSAAEVEAITQKFFQREEERQRENELLATTLSAEEVAQALGTTPGDVVALLKQARTNGTVRPTITSPTRKKAPNLRLIHGAYLAVIAALTGTMIYVISSQPKARPSWWTRPALSRTAVSGFQSATRDISKLTTRTLAPEQFLTKAGISSPPEGIKISLVTPDGKKSIGSTEGTVPGGQDSASALRRAIQSLLKYEESSTPLVTAPGPILDPSDAPYIQNRADFQGQPVYYGWHVVEISTAHGSFRAMLPDSRYFKDRVEQYERTMNQRLWWLSDAKFIPGAGAGRMKGTPIELSPSYPIPEGMILTLSDEGRTVYAVGTRVGKTDWEQTNKAITSFVDEVAARHLISSQRWLAMDSLLAIYPGGEEEVPNLPVGNLTSADPTGQYRAQRERLIRDLTDKVSAELAKAPRKQK